jgi:2-keto-4-pentenoate hydratase/2-oxohepta-3-ene-1,7-dioic acid hydratase in catechol pathway
LETTLSTYFHQHVDGSPFDLPVGKAVCVGRNYVDHAKEMGNEVPDEPMLFMKPSGAFVKLSDDIVLPSFSKDVHHEVEMAVLIGSGLANATPEQVIESIVACAVAIDLTARDVQAAAKKKGHPWEKAKAFDGSCPLSAFVDVAAFASLADIDLALTVNGELRQQGNTRDMVFPTAELVAHASTYFSLVPGDVVLTGTPAGVGALVAGDVLLVELGSDHRFNTRVAKT